MVYGTGRVNVVLIVKRRQTLIAGLTIFSRKSLLFTYNNFGFMIIISFHHICARLRWNGGEHL